MKPALVIMAAGMGSRFGGLKQLSPVGPSGEYLMDYSVYDALAAGFGKVVFVIKREMEQDFRAAIGGKIESMADVHYAFQELENVPQGCVVPEGRVKPWGTAHAVLSAKDAVHEPFAVINADDFYGAQSFKTLAEFLAARTTGRPHYAMVGFHLANTLSESGSVSRGVCECGNDGMLREIVERTHIERKNGVTYYNEGGHDVPLAEDTVVSMNMWGFGPDIFGRIEAQFADFFREREHAARIDAAEFYLPAVVDRLIKEGTADVSVLRTPEKWLGLTYPQDKDVTKAAIKWLVEEGKYPANLGFRPQRPGV